MKWLTLFTLLIAFGCDSRAKSNFTLDADGPWYVSHVGSFTNKIIEVRLYVTGPHKDFDSYKNINDVLALKPHYVTVDSKEIDRVLFSLGDYSDTTVPSNMMGMTYHIMLFESDVPRLMYFRVFAQDLAKDRSLKVYPSSTGFGYSSSRICRWLREVMPKQEPGDEFKP